MTLQAMKQSIKRAAVIGIALLSLTFFIGTAASGVALAGTLCGGGKGEQTQKTSIDIGCRNKGNPIMDATFGIIRFLSTGVGVVLVGSMIWAGLQYTFSRGDPQATSNAIRRIRENVIALLTFLFAYAILNYLIPGRFLQ